MWCLWDKTSASCTSCMTSHYMKDEEGKRESKRNRIDQGWMFTGRRHWVRCAADKRRASLWFKQQDGTTEVQIPTGRTFQSWDEEQRRVRGWLKSFTGTHLSLKSFSLPSVCSGPAWDGSPAFRSALRNTIHLISTENRITGLRKSLESSLVSFSLRRRQTSF